MIRVVCSCGRERLVPEMFAGRSVKCPGCGAVSAVPAAAAREGPPGAVPATPALEGPPLPHPETPDPEPRPVERLVQERFEEARAGLRRIALHLPFTSLSGAALVVAFFCLPWLRMSCGALVLGEPSGYDLADNLKDGRMRRMEEKAKEVSASDPTMKGLASSWEQPGGKPQDNPPWGGKSPELWAFPALGLALFGWSILRMMRPAPGLGRETSVALALVLGAGALLLYERLTWYRKPALQKFARDIRNPDSKEARAAGPAAGLVSEESMKAVAELVGITDEPGFWLTVVALAGTLVAAAAWLSARASPIG